ncbi:MAG: DUF4388 domain-containing protein [Acidobacteria bacterium]|nr:MAG: DUF4388 domain-containing protein [Acidobacteriota bacterium]
MAAVAAGAELTFPAEGRLAQYPLPSLLGWLGRLRATGALDVTRRKLVRRFVLEEGRVLVVVSNALEDRLYEWARESGRLDVEDWKAVSLEQRLARRPLAGAVLVERGLATPGQVRGWLRDQIVELLCEAAAWRDARYALHAGRAELGEEPTADLPAVAAALEVARRVAPPRRPVLPPYVVARIGAEELEGIELRPEERALLERAKEPIALGALAPERDTAGLEVLWAAGLLAEAEPPRHAAETHHVREEELQEWLKAAAAEQLERLLGVEPGADVDEVRRGYYRTVRRFHPDRFRGGPLARYHKQVESAFRLVHEALKILTDPAEYRAWQQRRRQKVARRPEEMARQRLALARAAARAGNRAQAVEHLERAMEDHPDDAEVAFHLALLLIGNPRRRREAAGLLEDLAKRHPHRADILAAWGIALKRLGEGDRAVAAITRALALDRHQLIARAARNDEAALERLRDDPFLGPLFRS